VHSLVGNGQASGPLAKHHGAHWPCDGERLVEERQLAAGANAEGRKCAIGLAEALVKAVEDISDQTEPAWVRAALGSCGDGMERGLRGDFASASKRQPERGERPRVGRDVDDARRRRGDERHQRRGSDSDAVGAHDELLPYFGMIKIPREMIIKEYLVVIMNAFPAYYLELASQCEEIIRQ